MTRAATFDSGERLPWLSDPAPKAPPPRSRVPLLLMAAAAGAAGAAGWTALQHAVAPGETVGSVETVRLLPPVAVAPQPTPRPAPRIVSHREALSPAPAPSTRASRPAPPPQTKVAAKAPNVSPKAKSKPRVRTVTPAGRRAVPAAPTAAAASRSAGYDPRAWNSGVRGRIIQLGAFRTPGQANGQWNRVYYRYPLLRPLPPRVVQILIRGRTYYRLQLGTFSHAHSELLCQRLRAIGEGCIVLGLDRRGSRA